MDYIAEPLQRSQIRDLACQLREALGMNNTLHFPVAPFLEHIMPRTIDGFHYEIVDQDFFPPQKRGEKHAEIDIVNRIIRIREDVYLGAVDQNSRWHGRDRMTIMHEIAHFILLVICGVKFSRSFGAETVPRYKNPEWQAKALAGEIMCPAHLITDLTVEEIISQCGVSKSAAIFNLNNINRSNMDKKKSIKK